MSIKVLVEAIVQRHPTAPTRCTRRAGRQRKRKQWPVPDTGQSLGGNNQQERRLRK